MRPRNKYEKRVAELNTTLKEDIAVRDYEWAKKETYKNANMGNAHYIYFTIYSNMQEFEVKRLYRLYRFSDKSTDHFFCVEIMREFIDGDKHTYFSKKRFGFGCSSFDTFSLNSEITLTENRRNYAGNMIAWLMEYSFGSHSQSTGKRVDCERRDCKELARVICNNPVAETMYKNNDTMFNFLLWRTHLKEICRAITLAKRHGFVFTRETIPLWLDMVYAIIKCGKDWHNPVYIAPKDLHATHDRFIRMMIRKQEQNRLTREYKKLEKELEEQKKFEQMYHEQRLRFFDMVLGKGALEIKVLKNIEAFREEADYMQHCVYKCRYWDMRSHPQSLIMSATIGGNKCETIEVDLSTYTIRQCFGKYDHFTNYHNRIVNFVNKHMDIIRAYNEGTVQLKKVS